MNERFQKPPVYPKTWFSTTFDPSKLFLQPLRISNYIKQKVVKLMNERFQQCAVYTCLGQANTVIIM